jgi:hypothetical protein
MASLVGKLLRHGRRLASGGIKFEVRGEERDRRTSVEDTFLNVHALQPPRFALGKSVGVGSGG